MKARRLIVAFAVVCGACTQSAPAPQPHETGLSTPQPQETELDQRRMAIYEAAFRALYETEGWYDPMIIEHRICAGAGSVSAERTGTCRDIFSAEEQQEFVDTLSDLANVRFTHRAQLVTKRIFRGTGSAGLFSVGPVVGRGDRVEVSGRIYCGGDCGHWMTMVLEKRGGSWRFTGTVGEVLIA
jgi:hypothetical protein